MEGVLRGWKVTDEWKGRYSVSDPDPGGKIALNIYRFNGGYRTGNIEVRILL